MLISINNISQQLTSIVYNISIDTNISIAIPATAVNTISTLIFIWLLLVIFNYISDIFAFLQKAEVSFSWVVASHRILCFSFVEIVFFSNWMAKYDLQIFLIVR